MKKPSPVKIIESEDGSHTLYHAGLNETYHSTHGALQESLHVYIDAGLEYLIPIKKKEIKIFEVGFGTGLNAWLTYKQILGRGIKITYHTLEPYPLEEEIYKSLNYVDTTDVSELKNIFTELHKGVWEEEFMPGKENFRIKKIMKLLEDFSGEKEGYDLIYFDAFAPSKQASLWSIENLRKLYQFLAPGGVLVTYCAKGQVKRDLQSLGFKVEALPGPPGKKEMTRAIKGNSSGSAN